MYAERSRAYGVAAAASSSDALTLSLNGAMMTRYIPPANEAALIPSKGGNGGVNLSPHSFSLPLKNATLTNKAEPFSYHFFGFPDSFFSCRKAVASASPLSADTPCRASSRGFTEEPGGSSSNITSSNTSNSSGKMVPTEASPESSLKQEEAARRQCYGSTEGKSLNPEENGGSQADSSVPRASTPTSSSSSTIHPEASSPEEEESMKNACDNALRNAGVGERLVLATAPDCPTEASKEEEKKVAASTSSQDTAFTPSSVDRPPASTSSDTQQPTSTSLPSEDDGASASFTHTEGAAEVNEKKKEESSAAPSPTHTIEEVEEALTYAEFASLYFSLQILGITSLTTELAEKSASEIPTSSPAAATKATSSISSPTGAGSSAQGVKRTPEGMLRELLRGFENMETIKDQYRSLAKAIHPDVEGGDAILMKRVNTAYHTIKTTAATVLQQAGYLYWIRFNRGLRRLEEDGLTLETWESLKGEIVMAENSNDASPMSAESYAGSPAAARGAVKVAWEDNKQIFFANLCITLFFLSFWCVATCGFMSVAQTSAAVAPGSSPLRPIRRSLLASRPVAFMQHQGAKLGDWLGAVKARCSDWRQKCVDRWGPQRGEPVRTIWARVHDVGNEYVNRVFLHRWATVKDRKSRTQSEMRKAREKLLAAYLRRREQRGNNN